MAEIAQDELTDAVYRAALEPTAWGDVMRLMKARFPSTAQTFYFLHRGSHQVRPISLSGVEPAWLASFDEFYFAPDNPWIRFTEQLHQPGVVRTNERLDAFIREHGTLYRSSYYNEWMRPHGFRYSLGSTLLAGDGIVANVTLLRPPDTATFSSEEVAAFTRLTGHLTRALQMAIRLERAETGLTSVHALAALPQAVALVDASHRVVYANAAMESRLREAKGLSLRHGVLHAMRAQPQLAALVSGAIGPAAGTGQPPLILACGERSHLVVHAMPVTGAIGRYLPAASMALLMVVGPAGQRSPSCDELRQRYGYTHAEARLAQLIVQGKRLRQAASTLGITYESARVYLKRVFDKTGVHGQNELVASVLRDTHGLN